MVADTEDTAADMLPAMVAVLGAGVAVAAVAAGTKWSSSRLSSVWMQHHLASTLNFLFRFSPVSLYFFYVIKKSSNRFSGSGY
jgi:hypothetical protein